MEEKHKHFFSFSHLILLPSCRMPIVGKELIVL